MRSSLPETKLNSVFGTGTSYFYLYYTLRKVVIRTLETLFSLFPHPPSFTLDAFYHLRHYFAFFGGVESITFHFVSNPSSPQWRPSQAVPRGRISQDLRFQYLEPPLDSSLAPSRIQNQRVLSIIRFELLILCVEIVYRDETTGCVTVFFCLRFISLPARLVWFFGPSMFTHSLLYSNQNC